jgi:Arc/MetJ family transcription regulator
MVNKDMRAIPIAIDDELYAQAEQKAVALDISLAEIVGDYLREWVRDRDPRDIARAAMRQRFANPNWEFAVGDLENRDERNARR